MIGCEGRLGEGVCLGALEDMVCVFVVGGADRANGGMRSVTVEEEAVGGPFPPKCFEEVGVAGLGECLFDTRDVKLREGGNVAFCFL